MQNENSLSRTHEIAERVELLRAANAGKLDGLNCPTCAKPCVSVWFTHPYEKEYRTWFICGNCGFEMRAQNSGRPPYYSKERDRTEGYSVKDHRFQAAEDRS